MPTPITVSQIRQFRDLRVRANRDASGLFLAEGATLVPEALASGWSVPFLIVTDEFLQAHSGFLAKVSGSTEILLALPEQYARISELDAPPGVAAVIARPHATDVSDFKGKLVLCCDGIGDPGNLGTLLRTAEWFGVSEILLGPGTTDPFGNKTVRASMGSLFRMRCAFVKDLPTALRDMQKSGRQVMVADMHGEPVSAQGQTPLCLVLGSEAHGPSAEVRTLADRTLAITGAGNGESLNVSVAAGIMLYALSGS
jgi:TrmH family RNA methyltransferase